MLCTIKIKPYGENEDGNFIEDFDSEEMETIFELFQSLGDKCKKAFKDIEYVEVEKEGDTIVINYSLSKGNTLPEEDFLFYVESLTGYSSDNIITFGEVNYVIKGSPVVTEKRDEFLSKIEKIEKDLGS